MCEPAELASRTRSHRHLPLHTRQKASDEKRKKRKRKRKEESNWVVFCLAVVAVVLPTGVGRLRLDRPMCPQQKKKKKKK